VNADWLGAPRLRTLRSSIGARGIKSWRAFGTPSHFFPHRELAFSKSSRNQEQVECVKWSLSAIFKLISEFFSRLVFLFLYTYLPVCFRISS